MKVPVQLKAQLGPSLTLTFTHIKINEKVSSLSYKNQYVS